MQTELTTAIIGAIGTILAAALGAYATVKTGTDQEKKAISPKARKFGLIIVCAAAAIATVILLVGFVLGQSQAARKAAIEQQAKVSETLKSYRSLVESGVQSGKRYIIPASVMLVDLERSRDGKKIESDRRMIYMAQMLSDISDNEEHPPFVEFYHSKLFPIYRIRGPEDNPRFQENNLSNKSWAVQFNAKNGDRHTILTGAHVEMPISISGDHDLHGFEGLRPNEDAYCYPNDDGDVMEELVIVVESHTLNLTLRSDSDNANIQRGHTTLPVPASLYTSDKDGYQTVVARFRNLQRDDIAGVRVGWKP